jgi:tRNA(Leu) C34 or U34 (ribose-2'-O)-methylase TrmL
MSKTITIASPSNPRVKSWRKSVAGNVRKTGRTLVAGQRIVTEVVALVGADARWLVPDKFKGTLPGSPDLVRCLLTKEIFKELDLFGTGYPMLEVDVANRVKSFTAPLASGLHIIVPTQDPTNVGAIVRTAVGLGVAGIHLLPSAAHPFHPRTVRASAGTVFAAPLTNLSHLSAMDDSHCPVYALDAHGEPITSAKLPATAALIIGQEGRGIEALDFGELSNLPRLSLPMRGIESYNAGVAAALAIYEWCRQHPAHEGSQ